MVIWVVHNITRNPIGPSALAYTCRETAQVVKLVLGFNYSLSRVVVNDIPDLVRNTCADLNKEIPSVDLIVKTEYDETLKRKYITINGRWTYHGQGGGSSSRLIDTLTNKTYTVPHDEEFRRALHMMLDSLSDLT